MRVHHVGYAVKNIQKSSEMYEGLGYKKEGDIVYDKIRNVNILFMKNDAYRIELIESADTSIPSPVDSYVKAGGAQPYHICYEATDLDLEIENLVKKKYILTDEAKKAPAIGGRRVAFLYKRAVGIIELVEM